MEIYDTQPAKFDPSMIGNLVTIQVIPKNGGDLVLDLMEKHVGVLTAYTTGADRLTFVVAGTQPVTTNLKNNTVEIYKHILDATR